MNLLILSASTVESLSNAATLREVSGTTSTERDTAQENALKRATAWAEAYVGRPLRRQVYQEVVPGYADFNLLLSRRPIGNVLRVFNGTSTGTATELTSTEYVVESGTGRLYRRDGWEWTVLRGRPPQGGFALDPVMPPVVAFGEIPSFLVEYSAGYVGPEGTTSTGDETTSTGRTLPYDIETAILGKAGEWQTFGVAGGPTVMSKSVGDLSLSYGTPAQSGYGARGKPESLLDQYRSIV